MALLKQKKEYLLCQLRHNRRGIVRPASDDDEKQPQVITIGHCPQNDCRGFLKEDYTCGLCNTVACKKCHEKLGDDEHKCDENNIETVKEIKKSTKSCPNCKTLIFKTEGCNTMWCTQCNTAFDWKTGKFHTGHVHNPHYFEFLRMHNGIVPRNPHDVQCGGLPPVSFLYDIAYRKASFDTMEFRRLSTKYATVSRYLEEIYRNIGHLRDVIIDNLPTPLDNMVNRDLRVDFLMGTITDKDFKIKLQRREKDRSKKLEYREILETYCNVAQDLFMQLHNNKDYVSFLRSELSIKIYSKNAIEKLNKKYSSSLSSNVIT